MTKKHVHATVEPGMINHTRIHILECDAGDDQQTPTCYSRTCYDQPY